MIQSLATRLDAQEATVIYAGSIGPLATGQNNANHISTSTPFGTVKSSTHDIVFPSGKFSSPPRVWLVQAAPSNDSGHGTLIRLYVLSVTVSGATIVASESQGSNSVTIDFLAIQQ